MRKTFVIFVFGCLTGVLLILGPTSCYVQFKNSEWKIYNPRKERDLAQLRRLAILAIPLKSALQEYHQNHGEYPTEEQLKESGLLPAAYIKECLVPTGLRSYWSYERDGKDRFDLQMKLGWEEMMWYHSDQKKWVYGTSMSEPLDLITE